jgi:hypothetical protein
MKIEQFLWNLSAVILAEKLQKLKSENRDVFQERMKEPRPFGK